MKYVNYDPGIVQRYKVVIKGWPNDIPMVNPSEIASLDDLLRIREAWRIGTAFWEKLTQAEVKKHMESVQTRLDAGETIGRKRKKRADAGKKRGKRNAGLAEKEDEHLSKRAKVSGSSGRSRVPPKSKEFVVDSDDEPDSDDRPNNEEGVDGNE